MVRLWLRGRRAVAAFRAHHGPMMAAAVSFWAVLSLVPTILLGVAVFGYFLGSSDAAFHRVMGYLDRVLSGDTEAIRDGLGEVVARRGSVGGLGLLFLAYSGTQWIVTLESALNAQWGVPGRSFVVSRLLALLLFVLFAAFLLFSTVATGALAAASQWRLPWLQFRLDRIPFVWQLPAHVLPILVSVATFGLMYRVLPNAAVSIPAAAEAALLAGGAWEGAKYLYTRYLSDVAHYDLLYGPVGAVVGLIVWIYYSSVLVLFGSEWARETQQERAASTVSPGAAPTTRRRGPGRAPRKRRRRR